MAKADKARAPKPGTAAELAALFPAPLTIMVRVGEVTGEGKLRAITYHDEPVTINVLPVDELGSVVDILAPLVADNADPRDLAQLAAEHRTTIYRAFARATGWHADEVKMIHPADFMRAVDKFIEANADFFVRLLGPAGFGIPAWGTTKAAASGDGPTSSSSSIGGASPIPNDSQSPGSMVQ